MRKILSFTLILMSLLWPPSSVQALPRQPADDRIIIGESFTLKSGETLDGDLVVIGGEATIEPGAQVQGDVVLIGSTLKLDGEVNGEAVIIGGSTTLGESASLAGDLVMIGASLQRAQAARIGGTIISSLPLPSLQLPGRFAPTAPHAPRFKFESPWWAWGGLLFRALVLAALAMLLSLFLQPQLDRTAQAITAQPFIAGSIGLLTLILAPLAVVILVVTILLIPVALAVVMLLVLAWLFGLIALGGEVGGRFAGALHQTWAPTLSAGLGTFLLVLVLGALNHVPCVGWMAGVLAGLIGLGAAVMTLFGTRALRLPLPQTDGTPPPGAAS